jgi:hypothetical protein
MSMTKRILIIVIASFALAFLAPVSAGPASLAAAAVVLTAVMLSIVVQRALRRHDQLNEWVAIELNKVRRIYHLARNLGETRHRQWFTELHGFVYAYLTAFDKKDFSQYQETNAQFRKLSYHLYQIPGLETEKERVLYSDLLEAAGLVAGARQRIQEIWNGSLPSSVWNGLTVLSIAAAAAVLTAMGPSDRFTAGFVLTALGAGVMLAREADDMRRVAGEDLSKRYVENIARLEMTRDK